MATDARRTLASIVTAFVAMGSRASAQIVLVVMTLVATRYLTPTAFGMFTLAAIGITLIRSILWNGAFEYLLKTPDPAAASSECLMINVLITGICSLILFGISLFADRLFGQPGIGQLIWLLLPSNLLTAISAWQEALVLRTGRLRAYYAITLASEAAGAVVAIALLVQDYGTLALVAQTYVRNLVVLVAYLAMRCTILSRRFSWRVVGEAWRWSVSRYLSVLVDFAMTYGADIFLGVLLSPAAAGLFRASNRIVTAAGEMFGHPANLMARSVFSQRAAEGRTSDDTWPLLLVASGVVGWAAMGGLVVTAGLVVPLALGPMWAGAAPLVAIIAVARAASLAQSVTSSLLVAYNRQNQVFLIQCVSTVATLLALAAAAPLGVLAATVAVSLISIATSWWMTHASLRAFPASRPLLFAELPIAIGPMLATMAAAGAARWLLKGWSLAPAYEAVLVVFCGIAAWALALVPLRARVGRAFAALDPA